jgi:hypothetical protein
MRRVKEKGKKTRKNRGKAREKWIIKWSNEFKMPGKLMQKWY